VWFLRVPAQTKSSIYSSLLLTSNSERKKKGTARGEWRKGEGIVDGGRYYNITHEDWEIKLKRNKERKQ